MAYSASKHDIGILKQDTTTKVGLILAKDKDGNKIYEEYDDEYLALHQSAEAGYESLQPEKEFRIGQESYRSGYGQREYDTSDPERYHVSTNVDHRNKGMAFPSYDITTVTKPDTAQTPSLLNLDMELDANWAGGVGRSAAQNHTPGGSFSWHITSAGAITQSATGISKGAVVTVTAWVYPAAIGVCKIGLTASGSTTYGSTNTGSGAWEHLTHSATILPTGVTIPVRLESTDENDHYFDDVTISEAAVTAGTTVAWADFNSKLYASFGRTLGKLNAGGTAFDFVGYLPATITDLQVMTISGTSYLFIAQGTGASYYYINTADTFLLSTAAAKTFQFFEVVHAASPTMWGNSAANILTSTIDPLNDGTAWAVNTTTVTGSADAITDLLAFNNLLYVMKEDRPYYLDATGVVKVLTNITSAITHSEGGKNAIEWNGNIYMPWSSEALLEYDDTAATFTWLNPSKYATESPSYDGQIEALAGDEEWLFAGVNNGVLNEIMCGRYETISGTTSWVWHPYKEITLTGIETMHISTVVGKRLWIASSTASETLQYIPLPTGYGDIATDDNRDFAASGAFETPWHHANFKGDSKAFIKCTLRTANCTANIYWSASYKKLGDTNWTAIGDYTTSPSQTRYIPVDGADANPTSISMKFKYSYTTDSTTVAPILYGWDVRGILYPTRRDLIYCEVRCADDLMLNDNTIDLDTNASQIKTALEEMKNTATWPVTFYDIDGNTINVKVLTTGRPFSKLVKMENVEGKKKIERRYSLYLQKVALS